MSQTREPKKNHILASANLTKFREKEVRRANQQCQTVGWNKPVYNWQADAYAGMN
jgi:hypothetical protein